MSEEADFIVIKFEIESEEFVMAKNKNNSKNDSKSKGKGKNDSKNKGNSKNASKKKK